jgi:5-methylcytosine-specific restriction endonuclease McrA
LREKYNDGLWTLGRFNSFVTSILRSGSRRWGPKYSVLNAAKTEKRINPKSGRVAQHFLCAICGGEFTATNVQVDHIRPIGFDKTWDEFIDGLFCEADNLQVLCTGCHSEKTKSERKLKQE